MNPDEIFEAHCRLNNLLSLEERVSRIELILEYMEGVGISELDRRAQDHRDAQDASQMRTDLIGG